MSAYSYNSLRLI